MFEVTIDKVTLSLYFSFYLNSNFPFKENFMIRAMKFSPLNHCFPPGLHRPLCGLTQRPLKLVSQRQLGNSVPDSKRRGARNLELRVWVQSLTGQPQDGVQLTED